MVLNVSLFSPWVFPVKTEFVLEKVNQNGEQRIVFGRKASHFEALKRGEIEQSHCTSIKDSLYNNLECTEKEGNSWHTEQQSLNRSTKGNNSIWWQKNIVRAVNKNPKTSILTSQIEQFLNQLFQRRLGEQQYRASTTCRLIQAQDMLPNIQCYLLKYSLFQYFCSPKNWVVWYQRLCVRSRINISSSLLDWIWQFCVVQCQCNVCHCFSLNDISEHYLLDEHSLCKATEPLLILWEKRSILCMLHKCVCTTWLCTVIG